MAPSYIASNSLIRASQYPSYRRLVWGVWLSKLRPIKALAISVVLVLVASISPAIRLKSWVSSCVKLPKGVNLVNL